MSKFETEKPSVRPFSQRISIEINLCEKKVIPFWSFIFPETYIYYISCIYLYCYRGEKVHNNYLMGLIFGTSRRVALAKKNSLWGYVFFKKGFKSNRFQVVVWSQNLSFFLFRISSQILRFSQKLRFSHFLFGMIF